MKDEKLLLAMAVVAVAVSVLAAGITYFTVANLVSTITGFGTTGETNLTVETLTQVNFTTASINFQSGRVTPGGSAASLYTIGTGTVTGGNWTAAGGLILQNAGNVNVSLNLTADRTATQFIAGTNPAYEWNITNNEANSCLNSSGVGSDFTYWLNEFYPPNTTVDTGFVCPRFRFEAANDQIRIDINLTIPENSRTGALRDQINATAYSV